MRVLHVIETLEFGGAEKIVVGLANALVAQHEIVVCCVKRTGALAAQLDKRVRVICLHKQEGNDYWLPVRLARLLRKQRFDVVHGHNWGVFLETGAAAVLARTQVAVHTVHGPYPDYPPTRAGRIKRALRHGLERRVARCFTRVVAVSDAIRQYMCREMNVDPRRVAVVHNGIPPGAIAPRLRNAVRPTTFITVGRLAAIKNHALMVRAFARFASADDGARLVIVGDGPDRGALEALAGTLGVAGRIQFTGFRTDIEALLADADVFLLTSHYEGISMALLEAMRCGLPAIATRVGGVPETIRDGETGLLVDPGDEQQLATAMAQLAHSPALRHQFGERARAFLVHEYSLDAMIEKYSSLYAGGERTGTLS